MSRLHSLDEILHEIIKNYRYTMQEMFGFELPSVRIARRTEKCISKFNESNCVFS